MALTCVRVTAGVLLLWSGLNGCGSDSPSATAKKKVCTVGAVYECVRGGCNGHQTCMPDGSDFTSCVCDDKTPAQTSAGTGGTGTTRDAGAGAAAHSGGAGGSNAGRGSTSEQCDNGKDDDGDGKEDCADSDCSEVSCVAEAPSGWQGPIALSLDSTARCDGALDKTAFEAGQNPSGSAASCSSCTCTPQGAGCASFVDFGSGDAADCGGTTCTTSVNQACTEIMPPCLNGLATARLKTKLPSAAGGCTASTQTATKSEASFEKHALACASSGAQRGGCKSGKVCLPARAGADFEPGYCVWKEGEASCPSGFTDKRLYHRELSDSRGCSACSCGERNCSYKWQIFAADDASCATPILQLTRADECVEVNPSNGKLRVGASIAGDGACTPAGGLSEGGVSGAKPITVCCGT